MALDQLNFSQLPHLLDNEHLKYEIRCREKVYKQIPNIKNGIKYVYFRTPPKLYRFKYGNILFSSTFDESKTLLFDNITSHTYLHYLKLHGCNIASFHKQIKENQL